MSELNDKKKAEVLAQEKKEPVQMPVLVLRGLVLYPQMVLHFDGRNRSLRSIR